MSRRYIIEIEEEPFCRKSPLYGEEAHFRAKGFKSLVFDQAGMEKLTPLEECLSGEALRRDLRKQYEKGYQDGCKETESKLHDQLGKEIILCKDCDWYEESVHHTIRCRCKVNGVDAGLVRCGPYDHCSYAIPKEKDG
jgi:hypothetical protein